MESLEMKVYQQLCVGCEYERRCHEEVETCEDFEDKLRELAAEEYFKIDENERRLIPRKIITKENKHYCPTCMALIGKYPYCKYCGQALEVEDENNSYNI